MEIRKTKAEELHVVMELYEQARTFMRQSGNANQWVNGYPSEEVVKHDIREGNSYVCVEGDGTVTGVFCFMQGIEPNYQMIEDGQWLNDAPYGVIHRMASSGRCKGLADLCLQWCFTCCDNIRVDTHKDNRVMQKVMDRNGFQRCGIIYVEDGTPRIAYQKCIALI